jgi:hypothetical protein
MRVLLVHWDDQEQHELASELRIWGHEVIAGFTTVGAVKDSRPEGVVISLRRMPGHGRQTAHALRKQLGVDTLPLLFTDGLPDRVADLMEEFHHARFVSWDGLESALAGLDSTTEELARPTIPMSLS